MIANIPFHVLLEIGLKIECRSYLMNPECSFNCASKNGINGPFVFEFNLGFGGMNIDIHSIRRHF